MRNVRGWKSLAKGPPGYRVSGFLKYTVFQGRAGAVLLNGFFHIILASMNYNKVRSTARSKVDDELESLRYSVR